MISTRPLIPLAALAVALGAGSAVASSTPKVTQVAIEPAPAVGKGVVTIHFRTDKKIARKANGKSLDASVGFQKATEHSVGSGRFKNGYACYVADVNAPTITVGTKKTVHILVQGKETVRTVKAVKDDGGKAIGC